MPIITGFVAHEELDAVIARLMGEEGETLRRRAAELRNGLKDELPAAQRKRLDELTDCSTDLSALREHAVSRMTFAMGMGAGLAAGKAQDERTFALQARSGARLALVQLDGDLGPEGEERILKGLRRVLSQCAADAG